MSKRKQICKDCLHEQNKTCTVSEHQVRRNPKTNNIILCEEYAPKDKHSVKVSNIAYTKVLIILGSMFILTFISWLLLIYLFSHLNH